MICVFDGGEHTQRAAEWGRRVFPTNMSVLWFFGSVTSRPAKRKSPRRAGKSASERSTRVGRVDPVEAVRLVEGELRLTSRSPWPSSGWRSGEQAEVLQDAASEALNLDDREQLHRAGAPSAGHHVERVGTLHGDSPREPTLATGVIGGYELITPRMNSPRASGTPTRR